MMALGRFLRLLPPLLLAGSLSLWGANAAAQQHGDQPTDQGGPRPHPRLRGLSAGQGGATTQPGAAHSGAQAGGAHSAVGGGHGQGNGAGHGKDEHGGGEHGAGEHGDHHPKSINWVDFGDKETPPYVALLINLALLLGLYYWLGKKPVAEGLKARRQAVAKEIEEAQKMLKEAEQRAKVYQAKLANVDSEQAAAQKALEEAGKGERDRILREADEKAVRMKRDAEFLIEQEVKQMRLDLTREAVDVAMTAAEKILAEKVTQQDHERMADEFLAELSKSPAAGGAS
jgi:F-type H+-transporting ATPase subunit b